MQNYDMNNLNNEYNDEIFKEEKIDGKIYLMATPCNEHREVQFNIANIFNTYFRQNNKRCLSIFDAKLDMNKNNYFEPDVMVFCYETSKKIPLIIIEVLSKSTRNIDLGAKMKKYAKLGIKEYWIITWESMSIDIYILTDEKKYAFYKSYAYFAIEDLNHSLSENEKKEVVTEFSPVTIPELKILLEDVFYFVK